jgi:hypothetical protein
MPAPVCNFFNVYGLPLSSAYHRHARIQQVLAPNPDSFGQMYQEIVRAELSFGVMVGLDEMFLPPEPTPPVTISLLEGP